ncbi:hypothetical protein ACFWBB_00715 [Streptomyces sp. NPDC060000]|uniref:hypothetical protein n=1 Tax=Streptomyces sp. NPDC060000 TaxID=3347031 RepID=UPI0036B44008
MSATDWELLLRDVALCLSAYQDRSPAVVWPEHAHAVLPVLHGTAYGDDVDRGEADTDWQPAPHGTGAHRLAVGLGHLMGYAVDAFTRVLPAGKALVVECFGADILILPLRGGVRCRIEPPGRRDAEHQGGQHRDAERQGVELRLRAGEILYAPASHTCALSGASPPCPLLLLVLHATP